MTTETPAATPTIEELTRRAKSQLAAILELDRQKAALDLAYERADFVYEHTKATQAIELGTTLIQIKAALPHGGWYPWLAENFSASKSTATRYMQCAELANRAPVHDFGYTSLTLLLPLSPTELTAFLTDVPSAANMSKRALREAVQSWRKSKSLPAQTQPVTIDVEPAAVAVAVDVEDTSAMTDAVAGDVEGTNLIPTDYAESQATSLPPQVVETSTVPALPAKFEQLSLFEDWLPALPPPKLSYQPPAAILDAAKELGVPCYVIERATKDEVPAPSILLALATARATWIRRLIEKSTAFIEPVTSLTIPMTDGTARKFRCTIIFNGSDIQAFASAFVYVGSVNLPYNQKNSAALTAESF